MEPLSPPPPPSVLLGEEETRRDDNKPFEASCERQTDRSVELGSFTQGMRTLPLCVLVHQPTAHQEREKYVCSTPIHHITFLFTLRGQGDMYA